MQTKLSFYLNEIFKFIVIFLLFFVWINYYLSNFLLSVVYSLIASAFVSFLLSTWFYKKQLKTQNTAREKKLIKTSSTQFLFNSNKQNLDFFSKVFNDKNIKNKIHEFYLELYPNTEFAIVVLPAFNTQQQNEQIIISVYNLCQKHNAKRALVLSHKTHNQSIIFAKSISNVNIILYDETDIFNNLLKPTSNYPESTVSFKNNPKQSALDLFQFILSKKNTKHYFWCAFIMIFASLFIGMQSYYLIFSSVFLIFAFLSFYSDKIFENQKSFSSSLKKSKPSKKSVK